MATNYIASCFPTSPSLPFLAVPNSAHLVQIVARTQPNSRVPSADAPGIICIAFLSILAFHPPAGKLKICQATHRSLRGFQYTSRVNQMIDPGLPLSFHKENYKSQNWVNPIIFIWEERSLEGEVVEVENVQSVERQKVLRSSSKNGSILGFLNSLRLAPAPMLFTAATPIIIQKYPNTFKKRGDHCS